MRKGVSTLRTTLRLLTFLCIGPYLRDKKALSFMPNRSFALESKRLQAAKCLTYIFQRKTSMTCAIYIFFTYHFFFFFLSVESHTFSFFTFSFTNMHVDTHFYFISVTFILLMLNLRFINPDTVTSNKVYRSLLI